MSSDDRAGRISLIQNSIFTSLLFVTSVVTSLVMAPVIVQSFGTEAYGVWELMLGLVGYLSLLDLGISPAIVRWRWRRARTTAPTSSAS